MGKLRRKLFVGFLALSIVFVVSCEKQGPQFNHETFSFDPSGGESMIIVTGPGSQSIELNGNFYGETCKTVASGTNASLVEMVSNSWLSVSDNGYSDGQRSFKITTAPNDSQETRKSIVLFNSGNATYRVTVSQEK